MRRLLALAATAALATGGGAAISACGSDDDKSTVDVGQTAKATAAKGTARMSMDMRMRGLGLPNPVTLKAQGVTDLDEPRAQMTMDLGPLIALVGAPTNGGKNLELTVDGADVYAKPPRIEGLTIPGGKQWIGLDLEELAEAAGLPTKGLGALFNVDPASQLRALKAAKGLEDVGKEEVNGVQTTHLQGTYRLSDVIAGLPEDDRRDAREALKALDRLGGTNKSSLNDPVRADIWVDQDGLTRRMRTSSKLPAQAGTPGGSFVASYSLGSFGARLDTSGPPASERYDATEALRDAAKGLAAGGR